MDTILELLMHIATNPSVAPRIQGRAMMLAAQLKSQPIDITPEPEYDPDSKWGKPHGN